MQRVNFTVFVTLFCFLGQPFAATEQGRVFKVHTCALKKLLHPVLYTAYAEAKATKQTHIAAEISGQIKKITVRIGQKVKRGEILAVINPQIWKIRVTKQRAQIKSLQAQVSFAGYQVKQARGLKKGRNVSEERLRRREMELAKLTATLQQAKLQLQLNQIDLKHSKIKAPFDGIITAKKINLGTWVNKGISIFTILASDELEIHADINERNAMAIVKANAIAFIVNAKSYPSDIYTLLPKLDNKTRMQKGILTIQHKPLPLIGSQGQLQWYGKLKGLPFSYLLKKENQYGYYWDDNGRAMFQKVNNVIPGRDTLLSDTQNDAINIIVQGQYQLTTGSKINVVQQCSE